MPKYKFTRVYMVEAPTQTEAVERCKQQPTEYLSYEAAIQVTEERGSWTSGIKKQVTGK